MQIKTAIFLSLSLFSFTASAINISEHMIKPDEKMNTSQFTRTPFNLDNAFCNKIKEPICKGKNCTNEKKIQSYIYDSCLASAEEKLILTYQKDKFPMGPVSFTPETYSGVRVFLSQFQDFLTINPDIKEVEYVLFVDFYNDIETKYRNFDNDNIKNSFAFTGKYLENARNKNKPMYKVAHAWAENVMNDRQIIEKQLLGIKTALESPQNLIEFKKNYSNIIANIVNNKTQEMYKSSLLTDSECKSLFRYLDDEYISEFYKETQFECSR